MSSLSRVTQVYKRHLSKYSHNENTSKVIRQKFLDYFINKNGHNFVKSSPVVPFCDPTIAFVNAGMNQFKNIFIGTQDPPFKKVANSQKCVRVGGKHNDLNVVGTDGYHHTFFEMLGNWSFGDYFKKEACELAWTLLTKEYKIHPSRLYVTYFKGDEKSGLSADLETKEIWRSIGVADDRILPFGMRDNFWEMGSTGPCGPCTEIHVDHISVINRAKLVNKGLHDLTELWNIVFIQYNRNSDNSISLLPERHVDTGMGFERLTAVLQRKISNYDTDNFNYLIEAIHKSCSGIPKYQGKYGESDWDSLDSAYRTLADHVRTITVCLADGVIPESNQKLRRILRKAFLLSETVFKKDKGLVRELSNYVIDNLGSVYCELEHNAKQIHQIIDYEEEVYAAIRKTASNEWNKLVKSNPQLQQLDVIESPSIVAACREIINKRPKAIDDQLGFKLYDTFGLETNMISKVASIFQLNFDEEGLQKLLSEARFRSKEITSLDHEKLFKALCQETLPKTESFIYDYKKIKNIYDFPKIDVKVLAILKDYEFVDEIESHVKCFILLDKTNMYTDAGGQASDNGEIKFNKGIFKVVNTLNIKGYILHEGFLTKGKFKSEDCGSLNLNHDLRLSAMRNHTATHILNAVVKELKGATCQKSSRVTAQYLKLDLGVFGKKMTSTDVEFIEQKIKDIINMDLDVKCREADLMSLDYVTLIPGEIYPDTNARLVEIVGPDGFISREPCCGTHVFSTSDLEDFSIISVKSLGRSTVSIHAVTGQRAKLAQENCNSIIHDIKELEGNDPAFISENIAKLREKLNFTIQDSTIIPYIFKVECLDKLNKLSKSMKGSVKENLIEVIEEEMQKVLQSNIPKTRNNQKYIVHYIKGKVAPEHISLQQATELCPDIPVLVVFHCDKIVTARCCVPENLKSDKFNAEDWLKNSVAAVFRGKVLVPKDQDGSLVCNMKSKSVNLEELDLLLQKGLNAAKIYIEERL